MHPPLSDQQQQQSQQLQQQPLKSTSNFPESSHRINHRRHGNFIDTSNSLDLKQQKEEMNTSLNSSTDLSGKSTEQSGRSFRESDNENDELNVSHTGSSRSASNDYYDESDTNNSEHLKGSSDALRRINSNIEASANKNNLNYRKLFRDICLQLTHLDKTNELDLDLLRKDQESDDSLAIKCYPCIQNNLSSHFKCLKELKSHLEENHKLSLDMEAISRLGFRYALESSGEENDTNALNIAAINFVGSLMSRRFEVRPAQLPFSAEALLKPDNLSNNNYNNANLLNYLFNKTPTAQPGIMNQFLLPLMFSSTMAAISNNPQTPATPPIISASPCVSPMLPQSISSSSSNASSSLPPTLSLSAQDDSEEGDLPGGNRRRRTRITEDQLKVLRQYFDINKSPSDEQISDIAHRTQLQSKVIKHWFRNTLFKERQKDKDSPYNFNNPPVTQLNLEEYEKTGKVCSTPAKEEVEASKVKDETSSSVDSSDNQDIDDEEIDDDNHRSLNSSCSMSNNDRVNSNLTSHRPNRTKFSDIQIKALHDLFRQQKYPKDEQVAQLAKNLKLKQRVITVWFQNARQKARKSSSQASASNEEADDDNENNYYENDDADDSHSHVSSNDSVASHPQVDQNTMAMANAKALQIAMSLIAAHKKDARAEGALAALAAALHNNQVEEANRDEENGEESDDNDENDEEENESEMKMNQANMMPQQSNSSNNAKRLRTTILPEQQEYLMQKYQGDQNPSRKMLDEIAKEVRLKKRVVQVWFQNTRARERKGIIKINNTLSSGVAPAQIKPQVTTATPITFSKRCPFCPVLNIFRNRSALESHLILKQNYTFEQTAAIELEQFPDVMPNEPIPKPPASPKVETTQNLPSLPNPQTNLHNLYSSLLMQQQQPQFSAGLLQALNPQQHTSSNNGLNSILMSSLFGKSEETPLDLTSIKSKEPEEIKKATKVCDNRSRSSSSGDLADNLKAKSAGSLSPSLAAQQQPRRVRTQMTQYQVNVMRLIFAEYKTPTMNECEQMGREINLKKRVVQVWFQNARAKEKKNSVGAGRSILFSNTANNDLSHFEFAADECLLCGVRYNHSSSLAPGAVSQQQRVSFHFYLSPKFKNSNKSFYVRNIRKLNFLLF